LTSDLSVLTLGMRLPLPFSGAFSLFALLSVSVVACTGGPDGRTGTSSSSSSGSSSGSTSGSGRTVVVSPDEGSSSTAKEPTEPVVEETEPTKQTFPCGASKECEVGREACVYYDGSPFACQVITVGNQCNAKSCTNAASTFSYVCDTTNYPYASCNVSGGDPCKMTIYCDP
jgi:hypothetical protein